MREWYEQEAQLFDKALHKRLAGGRGANSAG